MRYEQIRMVAQVVMLLVLCMPVSVVHGQGGSVGATRKAFNIQYKLQQLGYNIQSNGKMDGATRAALTLFRNDYGLGNGGDVLRYLQQAEAGKLKRISQEVPYSISGSFGASDASKLDLSRCLSDYVDCDSPLLEETEEPKIEITPEPKSEPEVEPEPEIFIAPKPEPEPQIFIRPDRDTFVAPEPEPEIFVGSEPTVYVTPANRPSNTGFKFLVAILIFLVIFLFLAKFFNKPSSTPQPEPVTPPKQRPVPQPKPEIITEPKVFFAAKPELNQVHAKQLSELIESNTSLLKFIALYPKLPIRLKKGGPIGHLDRLLREFNGDVRQAIDGYLNHYQAGIEKIFLDKERKPKLERKETPQYLREHQNFKAFWRNEYRYRFGRDLPPDWSERQGLVLMREEAHCQRCGVLCGAKQAHIHHILPRSKNGGHELENLAFLCIDCHSCMEPEKGHLDIRGYTRYKLVYSSNKLHTPSCYYGEKGEGRDWWGTCMDFNGYSVCRICDPWTHHESIKKEWQPEMVKCFKDVYMPKIREELLEGLCTRHFQNALCHGASMRYVHVDSNYSLLFNNQLVNRNRGALVNQG